MKLLNISKAISSALNSGGLGNLLDWNSCLQQIQANFGFSRTKNGSTPFFRNHFLMPPPFFLKKLKKKFVSCSNGILTFVFTVEGPKSGLLITLNTLL
jgi:hypothetical protein